MLTERYTCPLCSKDSFIEEWQKATDEYYPHNKAKLPEDKNKKNVAFQCPKCESVPFGLEIIEGSIGEVVARLSNKRYAEIFTAYGTELALPQREYLNSYKDMLNFIHEELLNANLVEENSDIHHYLNEKLNIAKNALNHDYLITETHNARLNARIDAIEAMLNAIPIYIN